MEAYIQNIGGWQIVAVVCLVFLLVTNLDKFLDSIFGLKDKLVDRKTNSIIEAALEGDSSLREEVFRRLDEAREDHEKYEQWFSRDNRRISALEDDVDKIKGDMEKAHDRLDAHAEESTIILNSMRVMMSKMLGLAEDSDIIDSVNEINRYLVERREK